MSSSGDRLFKCSWQQCGKSFNRKSDLCRHYRIHTNERPYHCTMKDCNKSFIQRSALTVHLRTHTGEKPYVCDHESCLKAFSDSSSLARHRRIHTGERPYACRKTTCELSFCRKATLTKHQQNTHHSVSINCDSEDATLGQFHQTPVLASMADDRYLYARQPAYPQFLNKISESHPPNPPITHVPVPEAFLETTPRTMLNSITNGPTTPYVQLEQLYEQSCPSLAVPHQQQQLAGSYVASEHLLGSSGDFQHFFT